MIIWEFYTISITSDSLVQQKTLSYTIIALKRGNLNSLAILQRTLQLTSMTKLPTEILNRSLD